MAPLALRQSALTVTTATILTPALRTATTDLTTSPAASSSAPAPGSTASTGMASTVAGFMAAAATDLAISGMGPTIEQAGCGLRGGGAPGGFSGAGDRC